MSDAREHEPGAAIVLAGLPGMGPRRLAALLDAWDPTRAGARQRPGARIASCCPTARRCSPTPSPASVDTLRRAWAAAASGTDAPAARDAHAALGVSVLLRDDPRYPDVLADDVEPPAVLFSLGSLEHLDRPRAAVVGTRRCTGVGAGWRA